MTTMETNQLIDKYLEGRTSPEEERRLALEVNRADAPQEWLIVRDMLGELTVGEAIYNKVVKARKRRRLLYYGGWSIAASLLLCLAMSGLFPKEVQKRRPANTTKSVMVAEATTEPMEESPTPAVPEFQPEPKEPVVKHAKIKPQPVVKVAQAEVPAAIESESQVEMPSPTAIEILRAQVNEEALAQVEQKFEQWQLRQAIRNEGIELEIATQELERKYKEYLADNVIEI